MHNYRRGVDGPMNSDMAKDFVGLAVLAILIVVILSFLDYTFSASAPEPDSHEVPQNESKEAGRTHPPR